MLAIAILYGSVAETAVAQDARTWCAVSAGLDRRDRHQASRLRCAAIRWAGAAELVAAGSFVAIARLRDAAGLGAAAHRRAVPRLAACRRLRQLARRQQQERP